MQVLHALMWEMQSRASTHLLAQGASPRLGMLWESQDHLPGMLAKLLKRA